MRSALPLPAAFVPLRVPRRRRATVAGLVLVAGWLTGAVAPVVSAPAPESAQVIPPAAAPPARVATAGRWVETVAIEDRRRVAEGVVVAARREAAIVVQTASDETARTLRAFVLPTLIGLVLAALATWRWLTFLERRRLNRRGQAVHADPETGLVLLHDPARKPTTVALRRDKKRERQVAQAAAALADDDAFADADVDVEYEQAVTDRIVAKHHDTEQRRRRQSTRAVRKTGAVRGFTLIEVMVSAVMLATALIVLAASIYTLDRTHAGNRELAKAQDIAQIMAERIQGASWELLGNPTQPWSWSRRKWRDPALPADENRAEDDAETAAQVPLHEGTPTAPADLDHDIVQPLLGINDPRVLAFPLAEQEGRLARCPAVLKEPSGLEGLKVYVEYYALDLAIDRASGQWLIDRRSTFTTRRRAPGLRLPASPGEFTLDLTNINDAIIARVLITWVSKAGGVRRHELLVCRRK